MSTQTDQQFENEFHKYGRIGNLVAILIITFGAFCIYHSSIPFAEKKIFGVLKGKYRDTTGAARGMELILTVPVQTIDESWPYRVYNEKLFNYTENGDILIKTTGKNYFQVVRKGDTTKFSE